MTTPDERLRAAEWECEFPSRAGVISDWLAAGASTRCGRHRQSQRGSARVLDEGIPLV